MANNKDDTLCCTVLYCTALYRQRHIIQVIDSQSFTVKHSHEPVSNAERCASKLAA